MFRFEHWKNYLTTLANLEHIDIELVESSSSQPSSYSTFVLPTPTHVSTWQRSCPLLSSVSVSVSQGQGQGQTMDLVMWEWKGSKWVDRVRQ